MTPAVVCRRGWWARLGDWFTKLGPCGNIGLMIGIIAGLLLTILSLRIAHLRPTPMEILGIIIIVSLFCWGVMVCVAVVFGRFHVRSVLWSMLLRSVVICLFTVVIAHVLGTYRFGIIIGIVVGLFFGYLMCTVVMRMRG